MYNIYAIKTSWLLPLFAPYLAHILITILNLLWLPYGSTLSDPRHSKYLEVWRCGTKARAGGPSSMST